MSSQSTDDMAVLRRKIAKFETARKIERVERMVRDLQATVEKKDLEQKMERMQAQAALEKKDLEHKMERMQAQAQAQAALEKKDLEQKMEKNKQQIKRMEADVIMRSENEKRDRLLENEKRDREADKKEAQAQHQIEQLKWEARFSQMEQQQAARAYNIPQLPNPLQYAAGTLLPLQPTQLQELRPRGGEPGPSHSVTPVTVITAIQRMLPDSTAVAAALPLVALPPAALPSAAVPSTVLSSAAARLQAASDSQPVQHQHPSTCDTPAPFRPLQQQQQQQQQHQPQHQHQVTAGPAARAGPVPLPANARTHFFLSHYQGTGGDQTNAIYLELKQLGFSCW
jgi:hypothetical protein